MNCGIQPDVHNVADKADMFVLGENMIMVMMMKMIMEMMMVMVVVVMMMKMMKTFLRKFSLKSGEWRSFNALRVQTASR